MLEARFPAASISGLGRAPVPMAHGASLAQPADRRRG